MKNSAYGIPKFTILHIVNKNKLGANVPSFNLWRIMAKPKYRDIGRPMKKREYYKLSKEQREFIDQQSIELGIKKTNYIESLIGADMDLDNPELERYKNSGDDLKKMCSYTLSDEMRRYINERASGLDMNATQFIEAS